MKPPPRPEEDPAAADARPGLAIVTGSFAPYRIHLHERVSRELTGFRLYSLFTHAQGFDPWTLEAPPDINPVIIGGRGNSPAGAGGVAGALSAAAREWRKGLEIIRWLRANHPAAVVLHGYNDLGRLRVLHWCRRHRVPVLLSADSNIHSDRVTARHPLKRLLKRVALGRVLPKFDAFLACGSLGRQFFESYGAPRHRVFFSPYEPDYDGIRSLPESRVRHVADRLGLRDGRRRIIFCARLVPVKRPDLAVDAFAAIARRRPEWDLLVVGQGPLGDALRARVPAGLEGRVVWAGFMGDQGDVSATYRCSDVLLLPSDNEPWAVVVNEAVAAGLAVVSTDVVGAAAELVRDGVNGRVVPPGDLPALTEALLDVTDPARLGAMKAASAGVLEDWRRRGDPVEGLRLALKSCGLPGGVPGR